MTMYTPPSRSGCDCNGSSGTPEGTFGGFMCVRLLACSLNGLSMSASQMEAYCKRVCTERIYVCLDTGSEGYFVMDDTGCSTAGNNVPQLLTSIGFPMQSNAEPVADFVLTIGDSTQQSFDLRIPAQWIIPSSQWRAPVKTVSSSPNQNNVPRTQVIVIGNSWMQALAVTWNCSTRKMTFSHLTSNGDRAKTYQGPKSEPQERTDAIALSTSTSGGHGGLRWEGISLGSTDLEPAGGQSGKQQLDTVIELRFMKLYSARDNVQDNYGDRVISQATTDPMDLSEPCLDAEYTLTDNSKVVVSSPVDTGSRVNMSTVPHLAVETSNQEPVNCLGSGTVSQFFSSTSTCSQNIVQDGNCSPCCQTCCLAPGVTADTRMTCSVNFCTGLLAYEPSFSTLSFPLAHDTSRLQNVHMFMGKAKPMCQPAPLTGLFGSWFWLQNYQQNGNAGNEQTSTGLPFHILSHLNLFDATPELRNMTMRFWRDDMPAPTDAQAVKVGRPPLDAQAQKDRISQEPAWMQTFASLGAGPVDTSKPTVTVSKDKGWLQDQVPSDNQVPARQKDAGAPLPTVQGGGAPPTNSASNNASNQSPSSASSNAPSPTPETRDAPVATEPVHVDLPQFLSPSIHINVTGGAQTQTSGRDDPQPVLPETPKAQETSRLLATSASTAPQTVVTPPKEKSSWATVLLIGLVLLLFWFFFTQRSRSSSRMTSTSV